MDPKSLWPYVALLAPVIVALYGFAVLLATYGSVRICRTRLAEILDRLKVVEKKVDDLRAELKNR